MLVVAGMSVVPPARPPLPLQYASISDDSPAALTPPEEYAATNGHDSPESLATQPLHHLPKKPPRRSISPSPTEQSCGAADDDATNSSLKSASPLLAEQDATHMHLSSTCSTPLPKADRSTHSNGPPKKPLLPPGYTSRHQSDVSPESSLLVKANSTTCASAELAKDDSFACPSGKPIRPAKPPAKYKLKVDLLGHGPAASSIPLTTSSPEVTATNSDGRPQQLSMAMPERSPAKPPRKIGVCGTSPVRDASLPPSPLGLTISLPPELLHSPSTTSDSAIDKGRKSSSALPPVVPPLPTAMSCHNVVRQCRIESPGQVVKHSSQPNLRGNQVSRARPGSDRLTVDSDSDIEATESCDGRESGDGFLMVRNTPSSSDAMFKKRSSEESDDAIAKSLHSRRAKFESRIKSLRRSGRRTSKEKDGPKAPSPPNKKPSKAMPRQEGSVTSSDSVLLPLSSDSSTKRSFRSARLGKGRATTTAGSPSFSADTSSLDHDSSGGSHVRDTSLAGQYSPGLTRSISDEHVNTLTNDEEKFTRSTSLYPDASATLPRRSSNNSDSGGRSESRGSPLLKNLKKNARPTNLVKKLTGLGNSSATTESNGYTPNPSVTKKVVPLPPVDARGRRGSDSDMPSPATTAANGPVASAAAAAASRVPADVGHDAFRAKLRPIPAKAISTEEEDSDNDDMEGGTTLFQYILVISLVKDESGKYSPQVSYRFPPKLTDVDDSKDEGLQSIPAFCFPDLELWTKPVTYYKSETFSFILTDIGGSKRFGYCRRLLPSRSTPCLPEVYCLISPLGCFSLYSKILDQVEQRLARSSSAVFAFLKAVQAKPFPGPGRKVVVTAFGSVSGMETIVLKRPKDSLWLEHVDFDTLASKVPCGVLLKIFAAIIMERHLIFTAERLSTLSSCILACVALLYPFEWQHVFIPVLPASLTDICCSPLPYIIGVMKSSLWKVTDEDLPIEENVIIVDLDEGKFLTNVINDVGLMPNKMRSELESALKVAYKSSKDATDAKSSPGNAMVSACLNFFVQSMGHYRKCFKSSDDLEFDFPLFVKSGHKSCAEFLNAFTQTQMFDMFIQERCDPLNVSSSSLGMFEQTIVDKYGQSEDYLSGRSAFKLHKQAKAKLKGLMKKSI
eukprot:scpid3569/ scgid2048/ Suppression of tumorigenicity 5 protein; DENN domain-containing protein 2B; HeLa tumor suppression 1